ncbi:MAG: hypothetical protein V4696_05540, partial [Pseudomonadota bacterium]
MIRENPFTTLRYPSACNWSGPTISEEGIMASGTWLGRINRSKTWPHPNTAAAPERPELANGAPSRQGRKRTARVARETAFPFGLAALNRGHEQILL